MQERIACRIWNDPATWSPGQRWFAELRLGAFVARERGGQLCPVPAPFRVALASEPNPDFPAGQRGPRLGKRWRTAASLENAVRICRDFIAAHDLGGGNWTGGEVRHRTRGTVARVSYNGRIWPVGNG